MCVSSARRRQTYLPLPPSSCPARPAFLPTRRAPRGLLGAETSVCLNPSASSSSTSRNSTGHQTGGRERDGGPRRAPTDRRLDGRSAVPPAHTPHHAVGCKSLVEPGLRDNGRSFGRREGGRDAPHGARPACNGRERTGRKPTKVSAHPSTSGCMPDRSHGRVDGLAEDRRTDGRTGSAGGTASPARHCLVSTSSDVICRPANSHRRRPDVSSTVQTGRQL